jgi:hypothetical protein
MSEIIVICLLAAACYRSEGETSFVKSNIVWIPINILFLSWLIKSRIESLVSLSLDVLNQLLFDSNL